MAACTIPGRPGTCETRSAHRTGRGARGQGLEPRKPGPKPGVLPITPPPKGACPTVLERAHDPEAPLRHRARRRRGHPHAVRPDPSPCTCCAGGPWCSTSSTPSTTCEIDRAVVVVGHGAERVTKKLLEDGPEASARVRRAARAARHRRRRRRGPHRLRPRRARRRRRRRARAARRHAAAAGRHHRRPGRGPPGLRRRLHPAHRPHGRPHRLRPRRARQATTGSRASSSRPTPPTRSWRSTRSTPSIYCFRRSVLGPGAAPPQPRQRPGRVLPHRRRRGARRGRLPGRRPWWPTTPPRPRASTTALQLAAAEAELRRRTNEGWHAQGRHHGRPGRAPTSTPPSTSPPTSPSSPARSSRAARVVGAGAEIGPDTRLVDCIVGAGAGGREHRRPRRRDRRRRPRRPVRRARARHAASPAGARHRAVLHCGLHLSRPGATGRWSRRRGAPWSSSPRSGCTSCRGERTSRSPRRSPSASASTLGDANLRRVRQRRDPLPLRRVRPRHRRLHHPDPRRHRRAVDQRRDHGAADHGRRRQAGVGQAHHRGVPLLRLRPPGPQGRGPRADHRQARRQHVRGRRRQAADRRSTCTPARSRASSTARSTTSRPCRCSSTTCAGLRRGPRGRVARRRPGEGGRALRQPAPRRPRHRAQAPGEGREEHRRGPRRRRRGRRPHLRAHRRHDRHRRHHRRRGRAAQGAGRRRRSTPRAPTACSRARPSTGSRTR